MTSCNTSQQGLSWGRDLRCEPGTVLFRPGDVCKGFVVIREGAIRVRRIAENGREITLYRVSSGEICLQTFGCLVEGRRYAAEGVVEAALVGELVTTQAFAELMQSDATFRDYVFTSIAKRFNDLEQLIEDVALVGLDARLARAVLRLMDSTGMVHSTHEALAIDTGSGRAAISRQLAVFARAGLLVVERGQVRVLDRPALETIAHVLGD